MNGQNDELRWCEPGRFFSGRSTACLVLAALLCLDGCSGPDGPDVLIKRDRNARRGTLQRCTADACVFGHEQIPRPAIEWIGLGRQPPPPAGRNPGADEVHLSDASVHSGKLLAVNATGVYLDTAVYTRAQVEWIHLASTQGGAKGESRTRRDEPVTACQADRPLGGRVQLDYAQRFRHPFYVGSAESRNQVLLWFRLVPAGQFSVYVFAGSTVDYEVSTSGYKSSEGCQVPEQNMQGSDHDSTTRVNFEGLEPSLRVQAHIPVWPDKGTCPRGTLASPPQIRDQLQIDPSSDGSLPFHFRVDAGACSRARTIPNPSVLRECLAQPEKFAVIPFAGSDAQAFDDFPSVKAKWEVCCGCGTRPDVGRGS